MQREKSTQRRLAKRARESLSEWDRDQFSRVVSERLAKLPFIISASTMMSYNAFGTELNLDAFHEQMLRAGKMLAFPVTYDQGLMEAFIPKDDAAWTTGVFGIRTPIPEKSLLVDPKVLDVIIVPCVGFDSAKMRIGWGGGYYDRYLPRCTNAYKVGVAFGVQRIEIIDINTAWDFALDAVMTEGAFYE